MAVPHDDQYPVVMQVPVGSSTAPDTATLQRPGLFPFKYDFER